MVEFSIRPCNDLGEVMLVRKETEMYPTPGISPITSEVIIMNELEIEQLIKVLEDYADERRDQELQLIDRATRY